jgi:hypothetical protein
VNADCEQSSGGGLDNDSHIQFNKLSCKQVLKGEILRAPRHFSWWKLQSSWNIQQIADLIGYIQTRVSGLIARQNFMQVELAI